MISPQDFIEIKPGIWYKQSDGTAWTSKYQTSDGTRFYWQTDGTLKLLNSKNNGYYEIRINNKGYRFHRLVWEYFHGSIPKNMQVDHINNIRDDNRLENLQLVTNKLNSQKRKIQSNNRSGYKGIFYNKKLGKYQSSIQHNNKKCHLGTYATKEEAARAYDEAAIRFFGEFALTNKMMGLIN